MVFMQGIGPLCTYSHGAEVVTENVINPHVINKLPRFSFFPVFHYRFKNSTPMAPFLS
jgi:hypothetical protein